jgi:hypothetical protein
MMTDTAPVAPPADRPVVEPADAPLAARERLLTGLGAAGSLLFAAVTMLGFGAAWAVYFYPPASLAATGAIVCAAFALAGLVQAARELVRAVHWRRRVV